MIGRSIGNALARRARVAASSLADALRARADLAAFEGKEAGTQLAVALALACGAAFVFAAGYMALFCVAVVAASFVTGWTMPWCAFGLGLAHLGLAALLLWLAARRLRGPFFTATSEQLRKDQEWLRKNESDGRHN